MRTLSRLKLFCEYWGQKCEFAALLTAQKCNAGQVLREELLITYLKNIITQRMTYCYQSKGLEMEPTISAHETLLVRKLPYLNAKVPSFLESPLTDNEKLKPGVKQQVHVGDIVVLKDPLDSKHHVVRRLAAVNRTEMLSTNKEDQPFI